MSDIKYQQDGANKAYNSLFVENNNRYLLADEVGLGKTVTAARVIAQLWENNPNKSIKIGYICSNKALARQNIKKLKDKIKEIEPKAQISEKMTENVSLGFLNLNDKASQGKISIYTITPSTTIKAISNGTVQERAYAYLLIAGRNDDKLLCDVCQGGAGKERYLQEKTLAYKKLSDMDEKFKEYFKKLFISEWEKYSCKDKVYEKCINDSLENDSLEKFIFKNEPATTDKDVLQTQKLYTLISYYEKIMRDNISALLNSILPEIIKKCESRIENYIKRPQSNNYNDDVTAAIVESLKNTCVKELVRLARKCMTALSLDKMEMDLYIADEIQNYSDIFKSKAENGTEMDMVIERIIHSDNKIMLMSATPFRYHSLLNSLENTEKDADADNNDDDNEDDNVSIKGNSEEITDKMKKYIESDSDIYKEFQNVVGYLKDDFDFKCWEEINRKKATAICNEEHDDYKELVKKQGGMLKGANISRVERYMSGKAMGFKTVNKDIPVDKLLLKELESVPATKLDTLVVADICNNDILLRYDDNLYIYHNNAFYKAPQEPKDNILDYIYEDISEDESQWKINIDDEGYIECETMDSKTELNKLENELKKYKVRNDYIKSTPALFSFKREYKKLENLKDQTGDNTLSKTLIEEWKPLFATPNVDDDSVIHNARIYQLFHQLFDKEGLHKLLFIPPCHIPDDCPLKGVYEGKHGVSKRLFFTDYNMTPKSLSALITYEASRRVIDDLKEKYKKLGKETVKVLPDSSDEISISDLTSYGKNCCVDVKKLLEYDKNSKKSPHRGSPYAYAMNRRSLFDEGEIEKFCKAYFMYMTKKSSLRVLLAYTQADNIYDAILEYGESGCIWSVFDEYSEYIMMDENESFATAFDRIMGISFNSVLAITKEGKYNDVQMNTDFASGHFAGDKNSASSAKTLNNKLQRFNSPFWPFQFISTSIGQEGFDFHVYCRKIVHWSLECNPVKFEQREGRINRYQGYAIRLQLDAYLRSNGIKFKNWKSAFDDYRNNSKEDIGLIPDFVFPVQNDSFGLERECYYYPYSFESENLERVLEGVGYYRSLLGQSGNDTFEKDFKDFVKDFDTTELTDYFVNLYPN